MEDFLKRDTWLAYDAISGIIFLVVVVGWALLVALYLASWGSQNYRVVIK